LTGPERRGQGCPRASGQAYRFEQGQGLLERVEVVEVDAEALQGEEIGQVVRRGDALDDRYLRRLVGEVPLRLGGEQELHGPESVLLAVRRREHADARDVDERARVVAVEEPDP